MKIKATFIFIALMAFFSCGMYAQGNGIKGKVVNREGRVPVQGAKVVLKAGSEMVAVTSATGEFSISDIPLGTYTLAVSATDFQPAQLNVKVENYMKDLNFITLVADVAVKSQDAAMIADFDTESSSDAQAIPVILSSSKDVYENIIGYKFSDIRFKNRGYESETSAVYLNGIYFNDALTGYSPWSLWTGLNEATRNQESATGLETSDYGVGGFNGATNINARASQLRKGYRFSVVNASGQYRYRLMATVASGEKDNGWSYALSASTRMGGNEWVNGVYYNTFAWFASLEKKFNDQHRVALTMFGSPTERGTQGSSTQEVYDMIGSNYYNPNWGYQDGKVRNSRVRNNNEPVAILNYFYTPNDKVNVTAAVSYRFGKNGYSALDWYDAPDPRPDYYRNLPSYYADDPYKASYIREGWLTDWNIRQVNWDKMYDVNRNSEDLRSQYILEERHTDQKDLNAKLQADLKLSTSSKLNLGAELRFNNTDYYKTIKDLLGGEYWIDIDKFAERDFASGDAIQNDLNHPNRVVKKGDRYGYSYLAHVQNYKGWFTYKFNKNGFEAYLAAEAGNTTFWREGLYRKGLFPDNSYGNSEKLNFFTYTAKGGLAYNIGGLHRIYANVAYIESAPFFQESFVSPRTRNSVVEGLTTKKTMSTDINYSLRLQGLKLRVTGFYTTIKDQTNLISFYDDISRSFSNFSMTGIDQLNAGFEIGVSVPITTGLSAEGAFSYGYYVYTSNPYVTQTVDNSSAVILENERVYWKDYKVPSSPQTALNIGLDYKSPKSVYAGVDMSFYDAMYLDMNPVYRTDFAQVGLTAEQSAVMRHQEMFDGAFVVNANIGKSWYIKNYNIGFSLEIKNILNNKSIKTGGYEQMRLRSNEDANGNVVSYSRFDSKYFYMFGTTYYLNLYFRF